MTKIYLNGEIVKKTRDPKARALRPILDYARREPITRIGISRIPGGRAVALFVFYNGATCQTIWESFLCCLQWIDNRRSWGKPASIEGKADHLVYNYLEEESA